MEAPEVGEAHGQLAVRPEPLLEHQVMPGTVHRLDAELPLLDLREVHVLAVVLVVAGDLEQLGVIDLRGHDLVVPAAAVLLPEIREKPVVDDGSLRQEERGCRRERVEREELELPAELAMIPRPRVFQPLEVLVELLLRQERSAVDALEHRVLLVPLPVGAGRVRQLEDPEAPGRRHMRPAAQIDELSLAVAGDAFTLRQLAGDLDLQRIVLALEDPDRLGDRHLPALDLQVLRDDLPHLGLDPLEVLGSEGTRRQEVVVVAVLDRRSDADLDLGEEPLDRLRRQVGGRVAVDRDDVGRLPRHDFERPVGLQRGHEVDDPAVELAGHCVLREARTDPLRDVADGRSPRDLEGGPVGQPDRYVFCQRFHVLPIPKDCVSFSTPEKRKTRVTPRCHFFLVGANGIEPLTSTV